MLAKCISYLIPPFDIDCVLSAFPYYLYYNCIVSIMVCACVAVYSCVIDIECWRIYDLTYLFDYNSIISRFRPIDTSGYKLVRSPPTKVL